MESANTWTRTHMHAPPHTHTGLFVREHHAAGSDPYSANGGAAAAAVRWSRAGRTKPAPGLYPEPLCRQETTILTLAASEEPSSTEGDTDNGHGAEGSQPTRKDGKTRRKQNKGAVRAKTCSEPTGTTGAEAKRDVSGRASGNSFFVSELKKPMESQAFHSVFPWMKKKAPLTGSRDPALTAHSRPGAHSRSPPRF